MTIPNNPSDYRSTRSYQFPQRITRWRPTGTDMYGRASYSVESFPARFQQTNRLYVDEFGNNQRSRGIVYTMGDDLDLKDVIALGDHTDESPIAGAFEIKVKRIHSNQRGTRTEFRYIF